ncbi:hypothetical protein GOP47_0023303, partial [Adiantum capillus-veneris]
DIIKVAISSFEVVLWLNHKVKEHFGVTRTREVMEMEEEHIPRRFLRGFEAMHVAQESVWSAPPLPTTTATTLLTNLKQNLQSGTQTLRMSSRPPPLPTTSHAQEDEQEKEEKSYYFHVDYSPPKVHSPTHN